MPKECSDSDLIAQILDGNTQVFKELVERYRERSYRIAYNFVRDYEDSRDLSQMAFMKAYRSLHTFDRSKSFYTWFYRILVNLCVDHIRKRKNRVVYLEDVGEVAGGCTPLDQLGSNETSEQIRETLSKVPAKYLTLIVLRDIEGMSCLEIAKVLKCSYTTVRWRLHRARNLFKKHWILIQKRNGVEQ